MGDKLNLIQHPLSAKPPISLSVIVPVYNAETYLKACLDSILRQTFGDFELLLINDGSLDGSAEICEQYAAADPRVRVWHQENKGVSCARNLGLSKASGTFLTFCDADDWISEDHFRQLMEDPQFDLVLSSYYEFIDDTAIEKILPDLNLLNKAALGEFLHSHLVPFSVCFSSPWGKRFSRQLVEENRLRFDFRISSGEDTLWVFEYYLKIHSVKVLSSPGYFYRQQHSDQQLSAAGLNRMTIAYTLKNLFDRLDQLEVAIQQDLSACRYNLLLTYFLKLKAYLRSGSLLEVRSKLLQLSGDADFIKLWRDSKYLIKGERRKLFDRLMLSRQFLVLALYLKLTKQIY